MRLLGSGTAISLLVVASGCSATVVDDGDSEQSPETGTQGSVTVERTVAVAAGADAPSVRTHVSARFMRLSGGLDVELADRVVGSPLELPADGSCRWRDPAAAAPLPESATEGSIELLDVGDIVVRAGTMTMPLAARAFPDVGDVVSGVVYTSRERSTDVPSGSTYDIETTGSERVEGFQVQVEAPEAPTEVRVAGQRIDGDEVVATAAEPLMLSWRAGNPGAGDRIFVDITPLEVADGRPLAAARVVRCAFEDSGSAQVPVDHVGPSSQVVEVVVHRWRQTILKLSAIDEAVVDFDFAVSAQLVLTDTP